MTPRWDDATGIVTPEAVELRFHDANIGSRGVGLLIDFTIIGVAALLLNLTIGWAADRAEVTTSGWIATTALIVMNFVLVLGYPVAFETLMHGRTPGKAAMGLRAVTVEGSPLRFRHAAIRAAFWLVDFVATLGVAGVISSLVSRRHQRLGDLVAGTVVVRERSAAPAPKVAHYRIPAGAAEYAATLDTSALSVADYEVVREFLLREHALDNTRRREIASRLARALGDKLHHQPPPGVTPAVFLTCLAVRYQEQQQGAPAMAQDSTAAPPTPTPGPAADDAWGDFSPPASS